MILLSLAAWLAGCTSTGCTSTPNSPTADVLGGPKAPCSIVLDSPAADSVLGGAPHFSWTTDCVGVRLEFAPTSDFALGESIWMGSFDRASFTVPSRRWTAIEGMMDGAGFWRVVGSSAGVETASGALPFVATTTGTARNTTEATCSVSLVDPIDGATLDPSTPPTFEWSTDCEYAVLELSTGDTFPLEGGLFFGSLPRSRFTIPAAIWAANADRFAVDGSWRVRGGALDGEHTTAGWSFQTTPPDTGTTADSGAPDTGTAPGSADGPRIWYLDVTSARQGDFLTLRGAGFGSGGTIDLGGVVATDVREWSDDHVLLTVPAGAAGPVTIDTSTGSDQATFQVHTGSAWYVDPSGDDSNSGDETSPLATVNAALAATSPGDTILIRAGTYVEEEGGAGFYVRGGYGGTASAPVTIRSYPGDAVVLDGSIAGGSTVYVADDYVQFVGLEIMGASGSGWVAAAGDHLRLTDSDLHTNNVIVPGSSGSGVNIQHGTQSVEILGNRIHDNGSTSHDHGLYVKGDDMVIAHNDIWSNYGYGVHLYNEPGDVYTGAWVHSNRVWENGRSGIILSLGCDGARIENNVAWQNGHAGIYSSIGPTNSEIIHNTLVGNARAQLWLSTSTTTVVRNNLMDGGVMVEIESDATGADFDTNLYGDDQFVDSAGSTINLSTWQSHVSGDGASWVADPQLVDEANLDFRPTATSPAVDVADAAWAPAWDSVRVPRPQGSGADIGAFEVTP